MKDFSDVYKSDIKKFCMAFNDKTTGKGIKLKLMNDEIKVDDFVHGIYENST